ncbi:hypothetical protein BgAZ_206270 [Babesia gibsoni]|uniref:Uncharacterized protein n=1 Tax=Babesia gibsoni TaxID=33632 RepID=A0AAD8LQY6_BABGI|nr:hypothetical protein BgAZ_206270 [Babesia gibsoni]
MLTARTAFILCLSLLVRWTCCFHVTPRRLTARFENRQYRNNGSAYTYRAISVASNGEDGAGSLGDMYHKLESGDESKEIDRQGDGSAFGKGDETSPKNEESGTENGDGSQNNRKDMYIIFRVLDDCKYIEEDMLYDIVNTCISSLVQPGFFNTGLFRNSSSDMPPLFHVVFNSFKAFDFVRAQLYSKDASVKALLDNFHFHMSRYAPSPDSYPVQVANYMTKRNTYQRMLKNLQKNRNRGQNWQGRNNRHVRGGLGRTVAMQFTSPTVNPENMFPPQHIPGIHIHSMMHPPPPPYMGQPGPGMPSHMSGPM